MSTGMEQEEPWGLTDDEPKYQPVTGDITGDKDDENEPMKFKLKKKDQTQLDEEETMSTRQKGTYQCDRCKFVTADFMNFITHKNAHMEKERKMASHFTCGMCEFATTNPVQMAEHIQLHLSKEPRKVLGKNMAIDFYNGVTSDDKENDETADEDICQEEVAANENEIDSIETLAQTSSTSENTLDSNQVGVTDILEEIVVDDVVQVGQPIAETKIGIEIAEVGQPATLSKIEVSSKADELSGESGKPQEIPSPLSFSFTSEMNDVPKTTDDDVKEIVATIGEPPLKWVSVADVQKQRLNTGEAANAEEVEPNALIGYLELRRIKPIKTPNKMAEQVAEQNHPLPKPPKQMDADDLLLSPVKEIEIKFKKFILVKFCTSKSKVIATDKGAKTIKERNTTVSKQTRQQTSSQSNKGAINANKPVMSPNKVQKPMTAKRSEPPAISFRSTRSKVSVSTSFESLERMPKKNLNKQIQPKVGKEPKKPSKPVEGGIQETSQAVDAIENGVANPVSQEPTANVAEAENDQEKEHCEIVGRQESVDADVGTSSPSNVQEPQAHRRFHRKPKSDILLRYQNEQNMKATTENQEWGNAFQQDKVIDLVTQAYDAKMGFQMAKIIAISPSSEEDRKPSDEEAEKSHLCKIVLSRCAAVDHITEKTKANMATKLKSTLRDCWQKVLQNGTTPEQKTNETAATVTADKFPPTSGKRKLEMPPMQNLENKKSAEPKKVYRCPLCEFSTNSKEELFMHSHQRHTEEEKMYSCETCSYITSRMSKLASHQKTHSASSTSNEENKEAVDVVFVADAPLAKKSKMLENLPAKNNTAVLSDNDKEKSQFQTINMKMLSKNGQDGQQRIFSCKKCFYSTNRLFNLKMHERAHSGTVNQYKCKHCSFAAPRWGQYVDHQMAHSSNSELSCYEEQCPFTTADPNVLKSHRRLHKVMPELLCNYCTYSTIRKDHLDKHYSRAHSEALATNGSEEIAYRTNPIKRELPFKCVICWYSAKDSKILAKHMQIHAKTETPKRFKCGLCDFRTNFEFALRRHERHSKSCGTLQKKVDA